MINPTKALDIAITNVHANPIPSRSFCHRKSYYSLSSFLTIMTFCPFLAYNFSNIFACRASISSICARIWALISAMPFSSCAS
jgi:hypothetical protein